jgi:hypothetical protein
MSGFLAALSQRPFLREERVKDFVRQKNADWTNSLHKRAEATEAAIQAGDLRAMLTFITEKRQRWLIVDPWAAYIVLDDRQWEKPQLQWRGELAAALPVNADEHFSEDEGVLTFGDNPKKWLYSKKLFAPRPAEDAVTEFLSCRD